MSGDHDTVIIGAGPIGLELSCALVREGVEHVVLDAGEIGATMGWWAPGTKYFSSPERIAIAGVPLVVPGQDKATREQYMDYLRGVVEQFSLPVRTFTRVIEASVSSDGFALCCTPSTHAVGGPDEAREQAAPSARPRPAGQQTITCRRLVLAIGNMHLPRRLDIPGENLPHVSHYLRDPHRYHGRRVLIVGGKNSAVEAAIRLYRVGASVTMSYRRDDFDAQRIKYWLLPELRWLIDKRRVAFLPRTMPVRIEPPSVQLAPTDEEGRPRADAPSEALTCDDVLLLTGYIQDKTLLHQLGVELVGDEQRPRFCAQTMQTNVERLYVAGTAVAGSQRRARVFIENAHIHVRRIVCHMLGREPPEDAPMPELSLPEN